MKTTLKHLLTIAAITCLTAYTHADVIVQWGAQGGETTIVTSSGNGQNNTPSTYNPATLYNPLTPALGYNDADPARTNKFGGAATANQPNNFVDNALGDYIQLLANVGSSSFYEGMLAWNGGPGFGQSAFLSSADILESFHVEFRGRGVDNNPTVSFLLETTAGWYESVQTAQAPGATWTTFDANIGSLTWTGFNRFGVTAGAGTPNTADFVSVGFYLEDTNTSGNFSGGYIRNFEVTAIPEPSTLVLFGVPGLAVFMSARRRRVRA